MTFRCHGSDFLYTVRLKAEIPMTRTIWKRSGCKGRRKKAACVDMSTKGEGVEPRSANVGEKVNVFITAPYIKPRIGEETTIFFKMFANIVGGGVRAGSGNRKKIPNPRLKLNKTIKTARGIVRI